MIRAQRALFVLAIAAVVNGCGQPANTSPTDGKPPSMTLTELDSGQTIDLQSVAQRNTVVYFWASWCKPCLQTLHQIEHDPPGIEVVPISVDVDPLLARKALDKVGFAGNRWHVANGEALLRKGVIGSPPGILPYAFRLNTQGEITAILAAGVDGGVWLSEQAQAAPQSSARSH